MQETQTGRVAFIRGDAATLPLPDASVDLIVTSPPYFALRDYKDGDASLEGQIGSEATPREFLSALWRCMDEWWRVLKPSGSVWVNLGDKYAGSNGMSGGGGKSTLAGAANARDRGAQQSPLRGGYVPKANVRTKSLMGLPWDFALGCTKPDHRVAIESPWLLPSEADHPQWVLRAEVIWAKPNGLPESVRDRVARKHEQWFHFTKSERYFAAVDLIREPHAEATVNDKRRKPGGSAASMPHGTGYSRSTAGTSDGKTGHVPVNTLGKLPGSVWTVATEPLRVPEHLTDHFAAFPSEFPRRIVLGWAPTRGVCVECGEGLRPVTAKTRPAQTGRKEAEGARANARGRAESRVGATTLGPAASPTTITGYACACDTPIATPTGSRTATDPSKDTGRAGFNRPRGNDEGSVTTTLWEHRHWAAELKASPYRARIERLAARLYGDHAFSHWVRTDFPNGARPIPVALREALLRRDWLTDPPPMSTRTTRPAVVLDPFGGTGTTAIAAAALGCVGISNDLSDAYIRLAQWRNEDGKLAAKVLERTHGKKVKPKAMPVVEEGQPGLFDVA